MANKCVFIGRLVKEPMTFNETSSAKCTKFTLAVKKNYTKDEANFIDFTAFGHNSDFVDRYLAKGALVYIEGELTCYTKKNGEGEDRFKKIYSVTVEKIEQLSTKGDTDGSMPTQSSTRKRQPKLDESYADDLPDIPF